MRFQDLIYKCCLQKKNYRYLVCTVCLIHYAAEKFDYATVWLIYYSTPVDYFSFEVHSAHEEAREKISDFLRKISPLLVSMSREPAAVRIAIFSAASSATMSGLNIFHMKIQVESLYSEPRQS